MLVVITIMYVINTWDGLIGCIPYFGDIGNLPHGKLENHMAQSDS